MVRSSALLRVCGVLACVGMVALAIDVAPALAARQSYAAAGTFGSPAAAPFESPYGIAVDNSTGPSAGDLYVTDTSARRVDKLGPTGNFILAFGKGVDQTTGGDVCTAASGDTCQAGKGEFGPGELPSPYYVAVDPSSGDVYVGDYYAGAQKYTPAGELITSWGEGGQIDRIAGESLVSDVYGVAVSDAGRLALLTRGTYGGAAVYLFGPEGSLVNRFTATGGTSNDGGMTTDGGSRFFKANYEGSYEEIAGGGDVGQVSESGNGIPEGRGVAWYPAGEDLFVSDGTSLGRYLFAGQGTVIEGQGSGGVECAVAPRPSSLAYGEPWGCGATETVGAFTEARGVATNDATGVVYMVEGAALEIDSFKPVALPEARTELPAEITPTSMRLEGSLDPLAGPAFTECHFEFGTTTAYESGSVPCAPTGPYSGGADVSAPVVGVSPETDYHYRLVATDGTHTYTGYDVTAESGSVPTPTVVSSSAQVLDPTDAILRALIAPGAEAFTVRFEYGLTTEYKSRTFPQGPLQPNADGSAVATSVSLSGLTPEATYHYRVMATNFGGTTVSSDGTFETGGGVVGTAPAAPATTAPAAPAKPAPKKSKPKKKHKPKKKTHRHKSRGHGHRKGKK